MRGTSGAISGILKLPLLEHAESAMHIEAIVSNFFTASPFIKKPNLRLNPLFLRPKNELTLTSSDFARIEISAVVRKGFKATAKQVYILNRFVISHNHYVIEEVIDYIT